jgi:hypothetical protein
MSIQDIKNRKILKTYCKKIGREGVAEKVIDIAKGIVANGVEGKYIDVMIKAGMIRAITTGATEDCYFGEKVGKGFYDMLEVAEMN